MHPLYRNIQFKPKIWGLYFNSLFSSLGLFLMLLMIFSLFANIFFALIISFLVLGCSLGYFYFKDNCDETERRARTESVIKDTISSYTVSDQRIHFHFHDF